MKIQRFEATDLASALRTAQQALGPDAVILQTRRVPLSGWKGLFCGQRVEVLAAVDTPVNGLRSGRDLTTEITHAARGYPRHGEEHGGNPSTIKSFSVPLSVSRVPARSVGDLRGEIPSAPQSGTVGAPTDPWQGEWEALRSEVADLRLQLQQQASVGKEPSAISHQPSVEDRSASPLTADGCQLTTSELARRALSGLLTRTIEIRQGTCTAVALVGPTGVGKTTTIAKLAAVATEVEKTRVAFATVDTYRIGAVEQLETYARLQEIPLSVVYTPEDVRAARERYRHYDLLLVDTTGRSPRSTEQLEDLAGMLSAASLDEVHLVLEARASLPTLGRVLQAFRVLRPTHLLLSKLDETECLEDSVAAALAGGLPLSYVTTGQRVPEDLAPADVSLLVEWMLGRS